MKKDYEAPLMEVIEFEAKDDIITGSVEKFLAYDDIPEEV